MGFWFQLTFQVEESKIDAFVQVAGRELLHVWGFHTSKITQPDRRIYKIINSGQIGGAEEYAAWEGGREIKENCLVLHIG